MKLVKMVFAFLLFVTAVAVHGQIPDSIIAPDRKHFNFLLGTWKVHSFEKDGVVTMGGDDTYHFTSTFPGAISSTWHFNRGTKEKPNFTDAYCYIAYTNLTGSWSFYYMSRISGQYFEGRAESSNWYFYHSFDMGSGNKFIQRQYWTPVDASTMERTTENSYDEGKTWKLFSKYVLKK